MALAIRPKSFMIDVISVILTELLDMSKQEESRIMLVASEAEVKSFFIL